MAENEADKTPCGLYRTTVSMGTAIQAGVLVYYHNHGNPGPGLYPVERWSNNKAVFSRNGLVVHDYKYPKSLEPLAAEGFYRVTEEFYCCEKHCHLFKPETLVQLGYNSTGQAILFLPEWSLEGIHLPEKGTRVEPDKLAFVSRVSIPFRDRSPAPESSVDLPEGPLEGEPPDGSSLLH